MTKGQLEILIERYRRARPGYAIKKHLLGRVAKELAVNADWRLETMLEEDSSITLRRLVETAFERHKKRYKKYQFGTEQGG